MATTIRLYSNTLDTLFFVDAEEPLVATIRGSIRIHKEGTEKLQEQDFILLSVPNSTKIPEVYNSRSILHTGDNEVFLFVAVSAENLKLFKRGTIDLLDLIQQGVGTIDDYIWGVILANKLDKQPHFISQSVDIPQLFLPEQGFFLTNYNNSFEKLITKECNSIKDLLVSKNASYGNSAFEPVRIFSTADTIEQLKVRIDDKLSRISRGNLEVENFDETVTDLIGYLILLKIKQKEYNNAYIQSS